MILHHALHHECQLSWDRQPWLFYNYVFVQLTTLSSYFRKKLCTASVSNTYFPWIFLANFDLISPEFKPKIECFELAIFGKLEIPPLRKSTKRWFDQIWHKWNLKHTLEIKQIMDKKIPWVLRLYTIVKY